MPDTSLVRSTPLRRTLRNGPALACYGAAIVMGVLYISDIATAIALASATDGATAVAWQIALLVGGLVGTVGAAAPIAQPSVWRWALVVDMIGAALVATCLAIYVPVVWANSQGMSPPWATICWVGAVCVAMWMRAAWSYVDRGDRLDVEAALVKMHED